ncbi:MAG: hypothetical protein LUF30_07200, partial [Lachnospiraceae bacterium]|nr:hypothetical protein [Lachnospiraceae bacterium]
MKKAIKNRKKYIKAWQLGENSDMEKQLIATGAIRLLPDGSYELFSQEAVNGTGEIARPGDYFKVDEKEGGF